MLLSVVHLRNKLHDYDLNFDNVVSTYLKSVELQAELVVYPEAALSGYAVIDSSTVTWLDEELTYIYKLQQYVQTYKTPIAIGAHSYDDVYVSVETYFLITSDGIQTLKTKERHNCIAAPMTPMVNSGTVFEIDSVVFSTLICSESMCVSLLDSALSTSDVLLNPSAFGETQTPENYPLYSSVPDFNQKLIVIPNMSMIGDEYQYGRTTIKRGNRIVFEGSYLHNAVILFDTTTDTAYEKH